ncbi:hypothetical protein [Thioclava sp. GXIMD4216]|uniref:hypothetical protein n=1 Tax=Thioclava sp. GXIMD4216 TaxID=3131929 RepID=UPI0030D51406
MTNAELYAKSPPLLTDQEQAHFKFGDRSIDNFFLGLSDVLKACYRNGHGAADVSKVLNARGARTACGAQWTPRLAWFLMKTWRTVHLREQKREAERRQAERFSSQGTAKHDALGRAIQRQDELTYKKVLRGYFKNPTLGEIFPELSAFRDKLAGKAPDAAPEVGVKAEQVTKKKSAKKPKRSTPVEEVTAVGPEAASKVVPDLRVFSGPWREFFGDPRGRGYLVALVREHPRLLELDPTKPTGFLGCLRSRKAKHPANRYWEPADADQVRLAIFQNLHL